MAPTEDVRVRMRDGTSLATDVYLPAGARRVPAVLARTPYDARGNPVWFDAIGRLFADAGMAFVAQDTRGRHRSEGGAVPFAPEAHDGWDTCDWIVRQPWSDGTLAVFGESYVGFTAMAAAASGHPAIRAAALRNTTADIAGDWLRHQGVLRLEFVVRWAVAAWSGPDNLLPAFDWAARPLAAHVPRIAPGRVPAVLDAWATGTGPARLWPGEEPWPALVDALRVPVHLTTGWWDLFLRGALRDRTRLAARPGVDTRLHIEPTDHGGHDWGDGPTPDPLADFDALAARMPQILAGELAFLRHHLLGAGTVPRRPVTWTLTHVGTREAASWPPPGATDMTLHLGDGGHASRGPDGGTLAARPDLVPVSVRWRHDPADPVPALEGEAAGGLFHRPDERLTQVRDDVVTFTSEPFRAPLDLAGPVVADLVVDAGAAGGHVMAKLCDVEPTGVARRIADGAFLVAAGGDGPARAAVGLGDAGYRVRPGHRLRLEVSSSAYPRYVLHPGTTDDPWTATRTRPATTTLLTGPRGSSLRLTVLASGAAEPG